METVSVYREEKIDEIILDKCQELEEENESRETRFNKLGEQIESRLARISSVMASNRSKR